MSAIIEVREVLDGSALSQSRDGSRSRTRTYLVETDGTASMDDVTSASDGITSIPAWGDPYISPTGTLDASIVATEKRVSSRAPTIYRVEVIYDSQVTNAGSSSVPAGGTAQFGAGGLDSLAGTDGADGSGEGDLAQDGGEAGGGATPPAPPTFIPNPLLRPPEISWGTRAEAAVAEEDKDGEPITNSAGIPFDPPLEVEERIAVLTVVKNMARYNGIQMLEYIGRTNHARWLNQPAGKWRLADANADVVIEEGIAFWKVRLVFEYRAKGWKRRVLDAGYMQLNDAGDGWTYCTDELGNRVSRPVPLDGFGYQADPNDPAHYITFNLLDEANFANLKPLR